MQHPEIVGCNEIVDYSFWYRLTSAASDDWTVVEELPASTTSYTLGGLGSADYVMRVVVTNDGDLSNFVEFFYGLQGCKFLQIVCESEREKTSEAD